MYIYSYIRNQDDIYFYQIFILYDHIQIFQDISNSKFSHGINLAKVSRNRFLVHFHLRHALGAFQLFDMIAIGGGRCPNFLFFHMASHKKVNTVDI